MNQATNVTQLIVSPSDRIKIGFTYINSYAPTFCGFGLATSSNLANSTRAQPFPVMPIVWKVLSELAKI
ncbi:MAG TPA: hypothetical protein V6D14_10610 [Coleofasciculaceae cyanobacterium]|jgi:hypothetical protein